MATNYFADHGTTTQSAKVRTGITKQTFSFPLSAALVLNDTITLANIPALAKLTAFQIDVCDLDSNGAPTVKLDVGDSTSQNRYVAATTKGQSPAIIGQADQVPGSTNFRYAAADVFKITVNTAPATGIATGTIQGWVEYEMDDA